MTTIRKRTEWIRRTIDETRLTITAQPVRQLEGMKEPEPIGEAVVFHAALASKAVAEYAMLHGFSKRLEDVAAQSAGTTMADKLADVRTLAEHYESGAESWTVKGTRAKVDPDRMLADLLASDPERLAAIMAAAQAAIDAKRANATG